MTITTDKNEVITEEVSSPQRFWRSLEERAQQGSFESWVQEKHPRLAGALGAGLDRRRFLQLMGASAALGGMTACTRQPLEKLVPYVNQPEGLIPGKPLFYASAVPVGGYGHGVLVESHEGRPTKIEGNPDHPSSLGASSSVVQASVLGLYDPDRAQLVKYKGQPSTWGQFTTALSAAVEKTGLLAGKGMTVVTGAVTSPTLGSLMAQYLEKYPQAKWVQWEAAAAYGERQALGAEKSLRYDLSAADVILTLESDLLGQGPGSIRYAKDFGKRRRVSADDATMNRLYTVESSPSATGSLADHRLALAPSSLEAVVAALAAELGVAGASAPAHFDQAEHGAFVAALAKDLAAHGGSSLVVAGPEVSAAVHTLSLAINQHLDNVGQTVHVQESVEVAPADHLADINTLAKDLQSGATSVLVMVGVNPAYDAPGNLNLSAALKASEAFKVHVGLHEDESAAFCDWQVPLSHSLEAWGDIRAYDGTLSIVQPLIEPLYSSHSDLEVMAAVLGQSNAKAWDLLREYWQGQWTDDFENRWRLAVHDGLVADTMAATADLPVLDVAGAQQDINDRGADAGSLELAIRADAFLVDGRFANNGWLQETPRPLTKLTWDNALLLSPKTARDLGGLETESTVNLSVGGASLKAPVFIMPGQADGVGTLHLGYGRSRGGKVAEGVGVSASTLRTHREPWNRQGLSVGATGETWSLACTQDHFSMEGRHLVRGGTLAEFEHNPEFAKGHHIPGVDDSLYAPWTYEGHAWGMSIDLSLCTGCNACVTSCQSENNIGVVGKEEVEKGRELHWLRIDRYFEGDADNPSGYVHQPIPCMHCENAPCEVVCPVGATTHSEEGLNDMVYNRCVGTRYCANNCPYKVRRYNFFKYSDFDTPSLKLMRNPDVTVRFRGVMEKCTYCVQRINQARIDATREDREMKDGDIVTACQQACPTGAIVFGDINDEKSRVATLKQDGRDYGLLEETGTRPRTTYLARLSNPNPEITPVVVAETQHEADH